MSPDRSLTHPDHEPLWSAAEDLGMVAIFHVGPSGPAPRDMDELEIRLTEADAGGERWIEVNYQTFTTGVEGKIPNA